MNDTTEHEAYLRTHLVKCHVPKELHDGIVRYAAFRVPRPGHFMYAVLTNDLREACARADVDCAAHLWDLVYFLGNYAPAGCWGSAEQVAEWLEDRQEPVVWRRGY